MLKYPLLLFMLKHNNQPSPILVRPCKGLKYVKYQLFNCLIC